MQVFALGPLIKKKKTFALAIIWWVGGPSTNSPYVINNKNKVDCGGLEERKKKKKKRKKEGRKEGLKSMQ